MDKVAAYIASGIIETYCLGFTSDEENIEVNKMAAQYPAIQEEIERVATFMTSYLSMDEMKPSPRVKTALMNKVYEQQASIHSCYLPLLTPQSNTADLEQCIRENNIDKPEKFEDNLQFYPLPSTREITNFCVWVVKGHEEEMHTDIDEYIAIIEGSCDMYFGKEKRSYSSGDIIYIPPHVPHSAIITSGAPMFALVQRQLLPTG
ncbi:MAG: hypothetical protein JWQ27_693 [Ferruginibacter sp.]|nr:hypothetical protein [Ferruginibacter sp.]